MDDILSITPFSPPVEGTIELPGSKSITNRALILAALTESVVCLRGVSRCEDTEVMLKALEALGFLIKPNWEEEIIRIEGGGGYIPKTEVSISVGNSGTAARFLTAILALRADGHYYLHGTAAMNKRPMLGLLEALESVGAITVVYHENYGHFPYSLRTHGIPGGKISVDARNSSQILSALMMVAPLAQGGVSLSVRGDTVSTPFIKMTARMMEAFGQEGSFSESFEFEAPRPYSRDAEYWVEPDLTAASYFGALSVVTGSRLRLVKMPESGSLQGDIAFFDILSDLGLKVNKGKNDWLLEYTPVVATGGRELDFKAISDTFLTLAAISPLLKGSTRITGIAHTRHQESNRVSAVAQELKRLGQYVEETEDSLYIEPSPLKPGLVETYGDHRIAMSFAVLGCHDLRGDGSSWLKIKNPSCCSKTFPSFFDILKGLHNEK